MPDTFQAKIKVTGLCLKFGSMNVLRNISLVVPAYRKSVLIGPSACGKSVLMKCFAGILRPSAGSIEIDGHAITEAENRRREYDIGVLFQRNALFDGLSVWENIGFKLMNVLGVRPAEVRRIAIEKLKSVQLPADIADLFPAELSGGMQKRVGIARALVNNPSLLLLDDPTAGLDPITAATISNLIDTTARNTGATVLTITSDMKLARDGHDYLFMLHEGALVWSGNTADIESRGNDYVHQLINGRRDGPIEMRLRA